MENKFEYSAFISYKRNDEKWAIWLQKHLEQYSIPSSIRKEIPRLPKRIMPVFRDKTDLGAGGLTTSLHKELERSHFLIVICSPHSASSDWVGKEIDYFRSLGREEKIIPLIIKGTPHSEDEKDECLHPIFKNFEDEPLGININEIGKQQALVKVLARILDLRFDALWRRHKRHLLQKKLRIIFSVFLLIGLGALYWFYTKPIYKYYADYVDRWGLPEGIIELDETTYKHRHRSFRFEYRRIPIGEPNALSWRLTKVDVVNSAGKIQEYNDNVRLNNYARIQIEYNTFSGTIKHIDFCNRVGKPQLRWKISSKNGVKASVIDFIGVTDATASGYLGAVSMIPQISQTVSTNRNIYKSSIKRCILKRDSNGYVVSMAYHSSNSDNTDLSKCTDINGVYKQIFSNDSLGRPISKTFLDINEMISKKNNTIAIIKYKYDDWSNNSHVEFLNSENKYVLNEQLCAKITHESDRWGNIVKTQYYGSDGTMCYNKDNISQEVVRFDENGFPLSVTYLDKWNRPCRNKRGISKLIIKCDSRGNQIENRFEDVSGKSCHDNLGVAKISMEYDRWGNTIYMATFGSYGELILTGEGIAGQNNKYDRFGNKTQIDFFGVDWNICENNLGFATLKTIYNERGFPIQYNFFNAKGEATVCNNGFASIKCQFDERGNPVEYAYFDIEDLPCINNSGFHKIRYKYDDFGNIIEFQFQDKLGNPCESKEHFSLCKRFPNSSGNIEKWIYYDTHGNPTKDIYGICDYRCEIDDFGRISKIRFFDEKGLPTENQNGIAGWNARYDSRGNQIECVNIGKYGDVCCNSAGISRWVKEFDERGNQLSYTQYGANGQLVQASNGVAMWKSHFNDRGLILSTSYYDRNGNPCLNTNVGYSRYEIKYNEALQPIEICTYDKFGKLCIDPRKGYAKWVAKYDNKGNKIEMLSYLTKDSLCVNKYGYAWWVGKYDKNGSLIENSSYDEKGNIIENQIRNNENSEKGIRKYNAHKFKYDWFEVVLGFSFLVIILFVLVLWMRNMFTNTIKENLCYMAVIITIIGFDYLYLRRFLLHYLLIPYDIYNYSWILCLVSLLCCLSASIFLFFLTVSKTVVIFRTPKHIRKSRLKELSVSLIISVIGFAWLSYMVYFIADETWSIYSNPL